MTRGSITSQWQKVLCFLGCALVLSSLSACSDPKVASKANFEKALSHYFEQTREPACHKFSAVGALLPAILPDQGGYAPNREAFQAMAEVGLLAASPTTIKPTGFVVSGPEEVPATRYESTKAGEAFLQQREVTGLMGKFTKHELCFGTPELISVDRFTEPADADGFRISQVTYRYRITRAPEWTQIPAIQSSFPKTIELLDQENSRTDTFVLTSEGWQHEQLFSP